MKFKVKMAFRLSDQPSQALVDAMNHLNGKVGDMLVAFVEDCAYSDDPSNPGIQASLEQAIDQSMDAVACNIDEQFVLRLDHAIGQICSMMSARHQALQTGWERLMSSGVLTKAQVTYLRTELAAAAASNPYPAL